MATKKTTTAADATAASAAPGTSAYVLRIELRGTKPVVWREVWVDAAVSLRQLHHIIQAAMGWEEAHLHGFAVPGRGRAGRYWGIAPQLRYEPANSSMGFGEPSQDDTRTRLAQLLRAPRARLIYLYDFGDDWEHLITLKKSSPRPSRCPCWPPPPRPARPRTAAACMGFTSWPMHWPTRSTPSMAS